MPTAAPPLLLRASAHRGAAVFAVLLCGAAPAAPAAPRPDPDAIREVRKGGAVHPASPRAISHYLEARRRQRAGDSEGAVSELRLAVAFDEGSAELRVSLAEALAELGRIEAAEEEAGKALSLARGSITAADAQVVLARVALARRQAEPAVAALREAMRIEASAADRAPPDPEAWRLLADVYLSAGRNELAEAVLDDLARFLPADSGAGWREMGRRALERGDPGGAERRLKRAVELDPGDSDGFRLLATAYGSLRRPREEREANLALLRLDPDDAGATLALGRLALREGDTEQARELFRRHVRASPDVADAHVRCAFEWLGEGSAGEALAAARAGLAEAGPDPRLRLAEGLALRILRRFADAVPVLELVPPATGDAWVSARVALADALSHVGRHADAERALQAALAQRPLEARLVTARARARVRAGRPAEAVAALRAALLERKRTGPGGDVPGLEAALADALAAAGRGEEALAGLRAALAERPRNGDLQYALATTLERLGQPDAAIAQMRALLVLEPDHAEAMNFIGYVLADQNVHLDEAERQVRGALGLEPRAAHIHDSLGWVLHRKGDHAGAVAALEEALRLSGPDPTVLEHLGDVYRALGRTPEAVGAWRRALAEPGDGDPADEAKRRSGLERKLRDVAAAAVPQRPVSLTHDAGGR